MIRRGLLSNKSEDKPRHRRMFRSEQLMALFAVGSRLAFRLAIFLMVLEVVAWFGDPTAQGRVLDGIAIMFSLGVIVFSTIGIKLVIRWMGHWTEQGGAPW